MYSTSLRWFLAGAVIATALAAAGVIAVALRRGCALVDDEDTLFPPPETTIDADRVAPAGATD